MPFNRIKLFPGKKNLLHHKREFFDALMQADQRAIRLLAKNIAYNLRQAAFKVGLREEDAEEIINDALVITITNIREGKMTFMDYSPVAYATGVGKKLIANRMRTQKPAATNTEELQLADDFDAQAYLENKEKEKLVGNLLAQLGENCQQLIRLKFFDQMKDREIVEQKLTAYGSVDSLKSKRSQCMKKLLALANKNGGRESWQG